VAAEAGLLAVAVAIGRLGGVAPFARLRLDLGGLLTGLMATVPLLVTLRWCLRTRWPPVAHLMRLVRDEIAPLFHGVGLPRLLLLALLAGVAEEVLFRGVLQPWLAVRLPVWLAVLGAGAIFGVAHWLSAAYAALAAMAGVYLGLLLLLSGNLLAPIVAHALYDFVALAVLAGMKQAGGSSVLN
jgi:membrane protease YdiL (CAAX protease family)